MRNGGDVHCCGQSAYSISKGEWRLTLSSGEMEQTAFDQTVENYVITFQGVVHPAVHVEPFQPSIRVASSLVTCRVLVQVDPKDRQHHPASYFEEEFCTELMGNKAKLAKKKIKPKRISKKANQKH